jgi:tetratricopeptide (TPR) repeat protein
MPIPISHYCQKCLAANPLGQDLCGRCGTRLMIVVEPSSARFEASEHGISSDEHLLERISIVENRLTRLTERLERSLDLLLRQAQNSYFDRSLIKSLVAILSDDGIVESARLERLWNERCEQDAFEQGETARREALRLKILATPPATDSKLFADLVGQGFIALDDHKTAIAIDKLQRAAEITESNSELNLFIGEHFFKHGKCQMACTYLNRVHEALPDDLRVSLLLGLACADQGEAETAKSLIGSALERGGSCFAGHCGLGWLHMNENNWRKALTQFKRALEVRPSPEAHFVLASLYYRLERDPLAIRHLRKAVEMDGCYHEALSLLALVYKRVGKPELAAATLSRTITKLAARRITGRKGNRKGGPLFSENTKTRLGLMHADRRLGAALRDDALGAFVKPDTNHP